MSRVGTEAPPALAFGEFVLDVAEARLTRAGQALALTPKPLAFLATLVQQPGTLVSKDELLDTVWRRRFVSDSAVKSVLSELRAVLGDDARAPRWIETVQARGYRFVGAVQALPAQPSDLPGLALPLGNLPLLHTPPLGRDSDLAQLKALIEQHEPPLLTLTGPAGVGKSLLALALATQARSAHADGVWLVDLAGLSPGCDALTLRASVAHALRLSDAAARDDEALARSLQNLSLLLVLDNAEHVLEPAASMLAQLLSHGPGLKVIATSREPLHLPMERVHRVPPLSVPDADADHDPARCLATGAGQLFMARVCARLSDFELNAAQTPALAALCRALDGLPLALELAAARVPTLGLMGLAQQLAPAGPEPAVVGAPVRLRLLNPVSQRTGVRYQTLHEALDWSHDLLTAPQQHALRRLAIFRGPFALDAAQQVCGDDKTDGWAVLDAVEALVDRSLLTALPDEPRQFRLLHSVRAHAHQRLVDAQELAAVSRRHFDAVLAVWQRADARALGDPALQWVQQHDHAIADLRAALAWGCDAVCTVPPQLDAGPLLLLAGASGLLWHRAGHAAEGVRWCERVLALVGADAVPAQRAGIDLALAHLGGIAMVLPAPQGLAAARRAVAVFADQGDAVRENYALYLQHTLMCRAQPDADRSACLQRMATLAQPDWGELLRRFERHAAAYEARLRGQPAAYLAFNQEELARCRATGAQWEAWSAGIGVMLAAHDNGRLDEAVAVGRSVLAEIRAAGRLRQNANRLAMWIMMLAESGDTVDTRRALVEALPILHGAGRGGMALLSAGWLAAHEQQPEQAAWVLARFDAAGRTGGEFGPGTFIRRSVGQLWARLRADLGDPALAQARDEADTLSDGEALRRVLNA
jgi:predicted ATPase/DNA-binding winged helix-turn-helix (wHTH) protein